MATFSIVAMPHTNKDGRRNVSIRITAHRKSTYIKTAYYVTPKELKKGEVSDKYILADLNSRIIEYEKKLRELGSQLEIMTAAQISEYLTERPKQSIDLIGFGYGVAAKRLKDGRHSIGNSYIRILNALCDFLGRKVLYLEELDRKTVTGFIEFLKSDRVVIRKVRNSQTVFNKPPISDNTLVNYITNLKTIYNLAINETQAELADPFRKLGIRKAATEKRVMPVADFIRLLEYQPQSRCELLSLDAFKLSFYLCGCNLADLYAAQKSDSMRFEYERAKTKDRRADRAFMSLLVPPDVADSYERCKSTDGTALFSFSSHYASVRNFTFSVNRELARVCQRIGIKKVTTYYARYMWANIARNLCAVSKDDVAMALNHVGSSVTDIYLQRDFSIVDSANAKVCEFIRGLLRGRSN